MISAQEALTRLRAGNRRFLTEGNTGRTALSGAQRVKATTEQRPFATILGCADSRVPVELLFDQSLGELFVVRVAGNIAASSQVGSIEYAASELCVPLVVVLGHSQCGAVLATLEELRHPLVSLSPNLRSIIECIRPSVEMLLKSEPEHDVDALVQSAVRANVTASVNQLKQKSTILQQLIHDESLLVVGAEYSLETGVVEFF